MRVYAQAANGAVLFLCGVHQIEEIQSKEKGDVLVDVKVTDSTGASPIECEVLWAWVSKQRK